MSESATGSSPAAPATQSAHATEGGEVYQAARDVDVTKINQYLQLDSASAEAALPVHTLSGNDPARLFGREPDLAAVVAALDPSRGQAPLVLLTTPRYSHGIGRTALALQVAVPAAQRAWFPGGIHYVDLGAEQSGQTTNATRALPALLAALGVAIPAIPVLRDQQLAAYERECARKDGPEGQILLVLDGVTSGEQVALLHPHGSHRLLVIPARPLEGLRGARDISIGPLDTAGGAGLLRHLIGESNGNFSGPRDAKLERIVWLAGGLPGALELIGRYIADRPESDLGDLVPALADLIDDSGRAAASEDSPLRKAARLIAGAQQAADTGDDAPGAPARTALARWITDDWLAGRPARWEIVAGSGFGKTSLLNALARRLRGDGGAVILLLADQIWRGLGALPPGSSGPAAGILPFCAATAAGIAGDLARALPEQTVVSLMNLGLEGTSHAAVRAGITDVLGPYMTGPRSRPKFAFLIDNLDLVPDDRCRSWLLELAASLACPLVLSLHPEYTGGIPAALRVPLPPLSASQVRLPGDSTGEYAARIVRLTGGRPLDVAGLRQQIEADPADAELILARYEMVSREGGASAAQLSAFRDGADRLCRDAIQRPEADIDLFDLLVILRSFSKETLAGLLAGYGVPEAGLDRLWEPLVRFPAIIDLDDSGHYQLHSLVRAAGLHQITRERRFALHQKVERALHQRMEDFTLAGFGSIEMFDGWIKYETPEWDARVYEWFYHAASGYRSAIGHETLVRLALMFFEAFWWLGCYVPCPTCDKIVAEAQRIVADRTEYDRLWVASLATVNECYPKSFKKENAAPEAWRRVADSLGYLLGNTMPGSAKAAPSVESARLALYLNCFLGDCARYLPESVPYSNEHYYDAARKLGPAALSDDEAWHYPYFDIFTIEGFMARGDLRSMRARMPGVREYGPDVIDLEAPVNYQLAAAYLALETGSPVTAVAYGANALLRAYIYNITQEANGLVPPTAFSRELQRESLYRLSVTLDRIRQDHPGAFGSAVSRLKEYFEPYWRYQVRAGNLDEQSAPAASASTEEIVAYYAPAAPLETDLGRISSGFVACAVHVKSGMEAELGWPPREEDSRPRSVRAALGRLSRKHHPSPADGKRHWTQHS